ENASLAHWLLSLAWSLNARVLPRDAFSLGIYLAAGCPIGGAWLGRIAEAVIALALSVVAASFKVLVTDLDNVLWGGVIAEDGMEGIAFAPEGGGYRHFIFQSLLARLKREGVLLCAVSRNDVEVATEPLRSGRMVPSDRHGADLTRFLQDLKMTLTIHDRACGERARAMQLITKTNQFNLNGRRLTDAEVGAILDAGGRLFDATLADRTGNHGEVL